MATAMRISSHPAIFSLILHYTVKVAERSTSIKLATIFSWFATNMWGSQMVIFLLMLKAGFEIQFKLGQPSKHVNDLKKKKFLKLYQWRLYGILSSVLQLSSLVLMQWLSDDLVQLEILIFIDLLLKTDNFYFEVLTI